MRHHAIVAVIIIVVVVVPSLSWHIVVAPSLSWQIIIVIVVIVAELGAVTRRTGGGSACESPPSPGADGHQQRAPHSDQHPACQPLPPPPQ